MPWMNITEMAFAKVSLLLVAKAEKKGCTRDEVDQVTAWLTGYTPEELVELEQPDTSYGDFFRNAPTMNSDRALITGQICGIRVGEIEDPLMQDIWYPINWWMSWPKADPKNRAGILPLCVCHSPTV